MTVSGPGKLCGPAQIVHTLAVRAGQASHSAPRHPDGNPTANAAKQWAFCAPGERSPGHLERHDHDQTD